jgi:hypothetical protein
MRIKILGPITPDRLTEALESAALEFTSRLGDDFEGFFGANLYLQAFANGGQQIEIQVDNKEKMITLSLPAGEALRPALSDEVKVKRVAARKAAVEEQAEREKKDDEARKQHAALVRERQAKWKIASDEQERRERQFTGLVSTHGVDFIARCNDVLREVWAEYSPVYPHGQKKGQLRDLPRLELINGIVHLFSGSTTPRKIKTPLSRQARYPAALEPYWKYPEWVDGALPKLQALMESYGATNTKS